MRSVRIADFALERFFARWEFAVRHLLCASDVQAYPMADLLRSYLRATHRRRPIAPVRLPGAAARAVRAGANLAPDRAVGGRTWEDFLAERMASGYQGDQAASRSEAVAE